MRTGKILSYSDFLKVPLPDNANFVTLFALAGDNTHLFAKKSDGVVFQIGGTGGSIDWGAIGGLLSNQADLQSALDAASTTANWGSISGTLADQADIQNALNLKSPLFDGSANSIVVAETTASGKIVTTRSSMATDNGLTWSIVKYVNNATFLLRLADTSASRIGQLGVYAYPGGPALSFFISTATRYNGVLVQDDITRVGSFDLSNNPQEAFVIDESNGVRLYSDNIATGNYLTINSANQIVGQALIEVINLASANIMISNSEIIPGQQYWIIDASPKATLGVVVIGAPDQRSFQINGIGGFLNCDYQQIGDYSLCESITGFAFTGFEGQWSASGEGTYLDGGIVFYGGVIYQVIDKTAVDGSSPNNNSTAYYEFTKENFTTEQVGYIQEWDNIEYDIFLIDTASIKWRFDKRGNQINNNSLDIFRFGDDVVVNNIQESDTCSISNINSVSQFFRNILCGNSSIELTRNSPRVINCNLQGDSIVTVSDADTSKLISNCTFKSGEYEFQLNATNYLNCVFNNTNSAMVMPDGGVDYNGKILENNYSTFSGALDITSETIINLSNIPYAGIITLESGNANESIDTITGYSIDSLVFYSGTGTDFKFNGGNDNLICNSRDSVLSEFTIKGASIAPFTGSAEFKKVLNSSTFLLTNGINQ